MSSLHFIHNSFLLEAGMPGLATPLHRIDRQGGNRLQIKVVAGVNIAFFFFGRGGGWILGFFFITGFLGKGGFKAILYPKNVRKATYNFHEFIFTKAINKEIIIFFYRIVTKLNSKSLKLLMKLLIFKKCIPNFVSHYSTIIFLQLVKKLLFLPPWH